MQMLLRTRPRSLDDLTVEVALVRPGPIQGGAVHPYLARREALRDDPAYQIPYDHPLLEEALLDTLGVIVYQDQVLDVAQALAGFTQGQAEGLRRAMSRRRSREALAAHWHSFRDGAAGRGVDEATANLVFEKILAFSAFGFPKSHAAAFGLLAYQSAWLHRHHPAAFLCALLNAQPLGFYPPATLVRDGVRRGVEVRGLDVNASSAISMLEQDGSVRLGLRHVRGLGEHAADLVADERARNGSYRDLPDLARRTALDLPRLELLVAAGACDGWAGDASCTGSSACSATPSPCAAAISSRWTSRSARRRGWPPSASGRSSSPTTGRPGSASARIRSRSCGPASPPAAS